MCMRTGGEVHILDVYASPSRLLGRKHEAAADEYVLEERVGQLWGRQLRRVEQLAQSLQDGAAAQLEGNAKGASLLLRSCSSILVLHHIIDGRQQRAITWTV